MTHNELLAKINKGGTQAFESDSYGWLALFVVVELHEPIDSIRGIVCRHCFTDRLQGGESYPCPTIQAIEKELG